MTLPRFWRRGSFSVVETADLVGVTAETLRTWLARAPLPDFLGVKTAGRIWLSGLDAFYYSLVRELTAYGVPVRTAMLAAATHANDCDDRLPREEYLVVRIDGDSINFRLTNIRPDDDRPALVLPIRAIAAQLIDRAAAVYVEEVA